jgi:hypothetical protein
MRTQSQSMQMLLAGEPTEIDLGALQGLWSDEQYLRLTQQTNRLLELTDGVIEVLPLPSIRPDQWRIAICFVRSHRLAEQL